MIAMLHRVRCASGMAFSPNQSLCVSPGFLAGFVADAKSRGYDFVSLKQLRERITARSKGRMIALTFDDGYLDNYTHAYPLLKGLGVPFAVFVATSFLDNTAVLWWYRLEALLKENSQLRLPDGQMISLQTDAERQAAFMRLRHKIMHRGTAIDGASYEAVTGDCGVDWVSLCKEHAMSWAQVQELSKDPLVTIGSHTLNHPALSELSAQSARQEIADSKALLEARLDRPVDHFCYPFGGRAEAGIREAKLVAEAGYLTATTTRFGNIFRQHQAYPHMLPRVYLHDRFSWRWYVRKSLQQLAMGRVATQ